MSAVFFFFFSSRRRHTRYIGDWSSDVCSSDLALGNILQRVSLPTETNWRAAPKPPSERILQPDKGGELSFTGLTFSPDGSRIYLSDVEGSINRSEERRVGKEWR